MLKNHIKIAWRSLWKNKFYTIINISGLAVGLATGIMLLLWVQNELSYDRFHKDHHRIYQFSTHFNSNGEDLTWRETPGPLAVFAKSIPLVKHVVRVKSDFDQIISDKGKNKIFAQNIIAYVDRGFFSVFSFNLIQGNKVSIFPNNNSVVITQSTAQKLFGNEDAMGKTILFQKNLFIVTGILQNFPENSSIRYDALFPMGFYAQWFTANGGNGDWKTIDEDMGNEVFTTYVKLNTNANPVQTEKAFTTAYKKARDGDESETSFKLQNLADIHLISADGNDAALRMVQIFMLVVILLLAIASINYVNLSTARSLIRAKEVGIRKIVGAKKYHLFFQFTTETIVLFCFATIAAIVLIVLLMPLYNTISGKNLSFNLTDNRVWKVAGMAVLSTLIASSIYPAILLSSFRPIASLKGKITSGIGIASFRKGLVVFQFAISVILLVCTITMSNQMDFIKNKDLGYDKSYVFSVPLTENLIKHLDALKTELKSDPHVINVAASTVSNLSNHDGSTSDIEWSGKPENNNLIINTASIDKNFISTLKMQFLEGRNFTGTPADSTRFILNETAVKQMSLKRPFVGQEISLWQNKGTIIGVLRDFHFQSLKNKISPIIFHSIWNFNNVLYVRTTAGNAQNAIATVEKQYKKYAGNIPFSYNFLDKSFEEQYVSDQRAGTLFNVFASIAIFISCLGLFGLVTYTAQVKTKEIGIRKTLGASVGSIVKLISKDFLKLVIMAIIIAMPIAWYAINKWLQDFEYRTNISWWIFVIAGMIAVLIALITVSYQAIKAALANPVKSLRTE